MCLKQTVYQLCSVAQEHLRVGTTPEEEECLTARYVTTKRTICYILMLGNVQYVSQNLSCSAVNCFYHLANMRKS